MKKSKKILSNINMSTLLILNLLFIAILTLGVTGLIVFFGIDNGFFEVTDGKLSVESALVLINGMCLLIGASMLVLIKHVFLNPIKTVMTAMEQLANGNFEIRVDFDCYPLLPADMIDFAKGFNIAAKELGSTEIMRKDFINNFSHEFKTPIVSISGFADLLLEEDLSEEEKKEYLSIIKNESHRLAKLSSSILMLSRVENQSILDAKEVYSLDEQIRQSILITEQKWSEKNLDFRITLEKTDWVGNETLMKEVWLNLFDNAAKFSYEHGTIHVVLRKDEGNHIIISITDQGMGMNEDTIRHIYDQFYQGDTSHKTLGNGLGMVLVKKILDLHEASIQINSKQNQGSCFVISLPN